MICQFKADGRADLCGSNLSEIEVRSVLNDVGMNQLYETIVSRSITCGKICFIIPNFCRFRIHSKTKWIRFGIFAVVFVVWIVPSVKVLSLDNALITYARLVSVKPSRWISILKFVALTRKHTRIVQVFLHMARSEVWWQRTNTKNLRK